VNRRSSIKTIDLKNVEFVWLEELRVRNRRGRIADGRTIDADQAVQIIISNPDAKESLSGFGGVCVEEPAFKLQVPDTRTGSKIRFSPIAFGNQTISRTAFGREWSRPFAQRFTALRPCFAAGLPLSVQSLQCERTLLSSSQQQTIY
jgi:hypothetical protein